MVLGGVAGAIGGAIGALTGAGATEKLVKLTITPLSLPDCEPSKSEKLQPIEVLFNPTSLSITKPVNWREPQPPQQSATPAATEAASLKLNAPEIQFSGGGSRTLTLELLFDVTEPVEFKGQTVTDVRVLTNQIVNLTRVQRGQATEEPPPVCRLEWGKPPIGSDFPFKGVITSLTQTFTLFRRNGCPIRATLSVQFREYLISERDKKEIDPEFTTRVVVRGDTVSSIAAEMYRDPKQWRAIAEANRLDDPRQIQPGQRLNIPKLQ